MFADVIMVTEERLGIIKKIINGRMQREKEMEVNGRSC